MGSLMGKSPNQSRRPSRLAMSKHNSKYIFSNSSEEEKAQIFKVKAKKEMEKRRSSVRVQSLNGLFGNHANNLHPLRQLESAKMVKEENEDSEDTSERYSKMFPPK